MRYLLITLTLIALSCSDEKEKSSFLEKNHETIKSEIVTNYEKNKQIFQTLAKEVAAFKILRSVQFKYGHFGLDGISVYCDSIDRNAKGYTFEIQNLDDPRLQTVLNQEGITRSDLENIRKRLDQINCNSFVSLRQPNINNGIPYIHVEFKYNSWNGDNFYFYKLFDKKMQSDMLDFFDRRKVVMGQIVGTGAILDTNAVWYLPTD